MQKRTLHIGIDFSRKRADVGLFGPQGQKIVDHRAFANSRSGYEQFQQLVLENVTAYGFEEILVSGEATSTYWMPFFMQLAADPILQDHNLHQYLLNPRWVKWYKKSFPPDHKTDESDPYYIADWTRTRRPTHEWQADISWLRLRFYTRLRFHLVQDLSRSKNFYQAYLFVLNSAYTQYQPFSDVFGVISSQILDQQDDLDWVTEVDPAEVVDFLEQIGGRRLSDPLESAQKLQQVAAERLPIDEGLADVLQEVLNLIMQHIRSTAQLLKQVEERIALEAKSHPEIQILQSIPGIGPVFASGIAAEIGSLERFFQGEKWDRRSKRYRVKDLRDVDAAVAKLAGLWWPRSASGDFEAEDRRLAKSGNRYLRYYLVKAADSLRQRIPAYAAYYAKKYVEVPKHQHKRALVLIARKSIRLYVGLLHRKEPYRSKEAAH
jgi:transposase